MHGQFLCGFLLLILLLRALVASAAPMNDVKNVFVIVMENNNWSAFYGNPSAPYINNTLLPIASHAEAYYTPPGLNPSLPNYLWMIAGTNFGITNDYDPSVNAQSTTAHLVRQLEAAGVTWKAYAEDISGTNCPLTSVNKYTPRHTPVVYFKDVTNNNDINSANCIRHVRPFSELATDISNNALAQFNFITPNLCSDGHDACSPLYDHVAQTDTWLKNNLPMLLNARAYQKAGAIFITWDEANTGDGPIGMIVLSRFAKGNGYSNRNYYNHGSWLRTVQEIFGVSPLLGDAANQSSLTDLFQSATMLASSVSEYYNTDLDHYFITADANEAIAIDNGSAGPGWSRTGYTFQFGGETPVCRFYGSQWPGPNSHFYTADSGECDYLKKLQASTPATQKRWNFESLDFLTTVPIRGICPSGTVPVYRAYNNGFARGVDSNHRISASQTALQQVLVRGWIYEGVVMCAPP